MIYSFPMEGGGKLWLCSSYHEFPTELAMTASAANEIAAGLMVEAMTNSGFKLGENF
jgi:hypothetical protein